MSHAHLSCPATASPADTRHGDAVLQSIADLAHRLARIEAALELLAKQPTVKGWYSTAELAEILDKATWTVREWARTGRIHAEKRSYGRGNTLEWMVSHEELVRIQNEGLLPVPGYRHVR